MIKIPTEIEVEVEVEVDIVPFALALAHETDAKQAEFFDAFAMGLSNTCGSDYAIECQLQCIVDLMKENTTQLIKDMANYIISKENRG